MASTMKICGGCHRHVWGAESRCPFCRTALPTIEPPLRGVRMVMLGLTIALGSTGCGPGLMSETPAAGSSTGTDPVLTTTHGTTDAPETSASAASSSSTGPDVIDDTSDDPQDDGCSFYGGCPSDYGSVVFECDIFAQDCPPGEKCMPWSNTGSGTWNATRCSPIAPDPGQVDEPCTVEGSSTSGIDDCDLGLMCFGVDAKTNMGTCTPMCTGHVDEPVCEDPGDLCVITNEGAIVLCLPECDPVLQDCPESQGCYPAPDPGGFVCAPSYFPEETQGVACSFINGCAVGYLCLDDELFGGCGSSGCCSMVCDLFAAEPDLACEAVAPGHVCVQYYEVPPPGYEHVGTCRPPA